MAKKGLIENIKEKITGGVSVMKTSKYKVILQANGTTQEFKGDSVFEALKEVKTVTFKTKCIFTVESNGNSYTFYLNVPQARKMLSNDSTIRMTAKRVEGAVK